MNVENVIREYIADVIHMSLATCADNKPWVCEVIFTYDDDLNLYWRSKEDTRHSQEIAANPNVAGNIVEQHGLNDKPRGVYFEGTAQKLVGISVDDPVYEVFAKRFGNDPGIIDDANSEGGHQFYKVTVSDIYLFDMRESGQEQRYHLNLAE